MKLKKIMWVNTAKQEEIYKINITTIMIIIFIDHNYIFGNQIW